MIKKGLFGTLVLMFASTLVSAGGMMEPGSASGALEIGGYADVLFDKHDEAESTFILGHFCLDVAADLGDNVVVAAEIEWARTDPTASGYVGNADTGATNLLDSDAELVCAYIDYTITEPVTLRAGKFLVPFNVYNTKLYPADVAKLATPPFMNTDLVPSKWAETGIQVYGSIDTGTAVGMDYTVYLVNGLETNGDLLASDGTVGIAEEEYFLPEMKNNDVDLNDGNKAIGGRLGIASPAGFEAGISGYKGAYTTDGARDLTLLGLDACYAYEAFEVRVEYVDADQEGASVEGKDGFYLQGAYKFLDKYEVVARYEEVDLSGDSADRITIGGNYTITDDLTFRVSYEWSDACAGDGLVGQLAVRF